MFFIGNCLSPNPGPGNQLWEVFFPWLCPLQKVNKWYYSFSLFYLFYSNFLLFLRFIHMVTFCSSMSFLLLSSILVVGPLQFVQSPSQWIFEFSAVSLIINKSTVYINAECFWGDIRFIYLEICLLLEYMFTLIKNWVLRIFILKQLDKSFLICHLQYHLLLRYLFFFFFFQTQGESGHQ